MAPPVAALSDDALRARLWRAAEACITATTPRTRDLTRRTCVEAIAELRRRRAPLTGRTADGTAW